MRMYDKGSVQHVDKERKEMEREEENKPLINALEFSISWQHQ